MIGIVQVGAVFIWLVRCRPRVIPAKDLLVPLLLMEAELGLPRLEYVLLALDHALLPGQVVSQTIVAIVPVEGAMVSLSGLLGLLGRRHLGHDMLGLALGLR